MATGYRWLKEVDNMPLITSTINAANLRFRFIDRQRDQLDALPLWVRAGAPRLRIKRLEFTGSMSEEIAFNTANQ